MRELILRRFTSAGLSAAEDMIDQIERGESGDPDKILFSESLTEALSRDPVVELQNFQNRFAAGRYFYDLLQPYEGIITNIERDKGLWTWLAFAWMDILAPRQPDGSRHLRARARWIANVDDYRKYYRHLLAGPYAIYRAHRADPKVALAVLATPVDKPGEVVEQFASRQEIITSATLMRAITSLYVDPSTQTLKRGAGGKGGGSARRLADVFGQFDVTWDIYGMPSDEILRLLPSEFDRFKS